MESSSLLTISVTLLQMLTKSTEAGGRTADAGFFFYCDDANLGAATEKGECSNNSHSPFFLPL